MGRPSFLFGDDEAKPITNAELHLLSSFQFDPNTYDNAGEDYPCSMRSYTAKSGKNGNLTQSQVINNNDNKQETRGGFVRGLIADYTPSHHNHIDATDTTECVICMCDYEEGDYLRRFQCRHDFHQSCIDSWLNTKAACPVCRVKIVEHDGNGNTISVDGRRFDGDGRG